jgi:hypothetical protein
VTAGRRVGFIETANIAVRATALLLGVWWRARRERVPFGEMLQRMQAETEAELSDAERQELERYRAAREAERRRHEPRQ